MSGLRSILRPYCGRTSYFDRDKLDEIGCTCPACGVVSSETEWKEQYINGKFVAAHPERKVRGFHLNALASLFVDWREIVEKFLTANEEKKKATSNF